MNIKSKRLTSSLVALALVSVIALAYAEWASRAAGRPLARATSAVSATSAAAWSPSSTTLGKDVCAAAHDRCACAAEHGAELLSACFPERALQWVSRAPESCSLPALAGVHAEALAAIERTPEADALAVSALKSDPKNRFARRALAISAIQRRDFVASDAALAKLLLEDANDLDSRYYLALSERRRDHYNAAREGFLAVLKANAQHIDSRFNLVTLTARAGADQEAEHHYQELLQIAPVGDPRLIAARAALRGQNSDANEPAELPILHRTGAVPSIAPSH